MLDVVGQVSLIQAVAASICGASKYRIADLVKSVDTFTMACSHDLVPT